MDIYFEKFLLRIKSTSLNIFKYDLFLNPIKIWESYSGENDFNFRDKIVSLMGERTLMHWRLMILK